MITEEKVTDYNSHPKLVEKLKGFKVHLGFGLHVGWSIEGAIGSHFKIDMSYLSPHVNMSARLEGLTKEYKKPFLFTRAFYNLIRTENIKRICRKLDYITVKGSGKLTEIYTIDLNEE